MCCISLILRHRPPSLLKEAGAFFNLTIVPDYALFYQPEHYLKPSITAFVSGFPTGESTSVSKYQTSFLIFKNNSCKFSNQSVFTFKTA
jgi:hypothetical protein